MSIKTGTSFPKWMWDKDELLEMCEFASLCWVAVPPTHQRNVLLYECAQEEKPCEIEINSTGKSQDIVPQCSCPLH